MVVERRFIWISYGPITQHVQNIKSLSLRGWKLQWRISIPALACPIVLLLLAHSATQKTWTKMAWLSIVFQVILENTQKRYAQFAPPCHGVTQASEVQTWYNIWKFVINFHMILLWIIMWMKMKCFRKPLNFHSKIWDIRISIFFSHKINSWSSLSEYCYCRGFICA